MIKEIITPKKKTVRIILCALIILAVWAYADNRGIWPVPSGNGSSYDGKLAVDSGNADQGYFFASVSTPVSHKLKLRVEKDGTTLTYDLNGEGKQEIFPLQLGSGVYSVSLYENVGGKKYSQEGHISVSANLSDPSSPFLGPNQYVNYTEGSALEQIADSLFAGLTGEEAFEAVCAYMKTEFVYDYVRSVSVSPGELPSIDACLEKKMGICQDLSAVMTGLLRLCGVPARLMIGYADKNYHAWIEADVNGKTISYDPTLQLGAITSPKDYSVERYY